MRRAQLTSEPATDSPGDPPSGPTIDLRSDVLAPPTRAMFEAISNASIGLATHSEDRSVKELERLGARMLGSEECLFVPSATSANLLGVLVQAGRGSAVLLDEASHINQVEWYGLTAMGGLVPSPLSSDRGHLDPAEVEAALVETEGGRRPPVSLLCLENTHNFAGGTTLSVDETRALAALAHGHGAAVHLDGGRLFNAATALGVTAAELAERVDTVAVSLSKGLCAPFGGLLAGPAAVIDRARELGYRIGFLRLHKAGYLAAACVVALETMVERLADDHRRAQRLAEALARLPGVTVDMATVQTNIVMLRLDEGLGDSARFADRLRSLGLGLMPLSGGRLRAVLHRGIDDAAVDEAIDILRRALA